MEQAPIQHRPPTRVKSIGDGVASYSEWPRRLNL